MLLFLTYDALTLSQSRPVHSETCEYFEGRISSTGRFTSHVTSQLCSNRFTGGDLGPRRITHQHQWRTEISLFRFAHSSFESVPTGQMDRSRRSMPISAVSRNTHHDSRMDGQTFDPNQQIVVICSFRKLLGWPLPTPNVWGVLGLGYRDAIPTEFVVLVIVPTEHLATLADLSGDQIRDCQRFRPCHVFPLCGSFLTDNSGICRVQIRLLTQM